MREEGAGGIDHVGGVGGGHFLEFSLRHVLLLNSAVKTVARAVVVYF